MPVLMENMVGNTVEPMEGTMCVTILSPILKEETAGPVRRMIPEPSEPGIREGERGKFSALC